MPGILAPPSGRLYAQNAPARADASPTAAVPTTAFDQLTMAADVAIDERKAGVVAPMDTSSSSDRPMPGSTPIEVEAVPTTSMQTALPGRSHTIGCP